MRPKQAQVVQDPQRDGVRAQQSGTGRNLDQAGVEAIVTSMTNPALKSGLVGKGGMARLFPVEARPGFVTSPDERESTIDAIA